MPLWITQPWDSSVVPLQLTLLPSSLRRGKQSRKLWEKVNLNEENVVTVKFQAVTMVQKKAMTMAVKIAKN
jgi:hypothetical protein